MQQGPVITQGGAIIANVNDGKGQGANARLIAEAGTVFHKTGLTPRQLLEQRDALLQMLRRLEDIYSGLEATCDNLGVDLTEVRDAWCDAYQLLQQHGGAADEVGE